MILERVRRHGRLLSAVLLLVALAFLASTLVTSWRQVAADVSAIEPLPFLLGVILMLGQTVLVAAIWCELYRAGGPRVPLARAYRIIFVASLGKYLPGRVWAFGGLAALAREAGLSVAGVAAASGTTLALVVGSGLFMGTASYVLWRAEAAATVALLVGAAAVALPRAIGETLRWPGPRRILNAAALANLSWLLLAGANWAIARSLAPVGPGLAPALLASAVAGWAAGLAAVAVPAGLGVREAVQALVVQDVLPPSTAAAFTLVVRLALIVTDLLAAAIGALLRPRNGTALEARAPLPHH